MEGGKSQGMEGVGANGGDMDQGMDGVWSQGLYGEGPGEGREPRNGRG